MCNKLSVCPRCLPCHCSQPDSPFTCGDAFGCPIPNSTCSGKGTSHYAIPEGFRIIWEQWDARIMILYILFTQLYLQLLGARRSKANRTRMVVDKSAWSIYLLSDLVAAIALGKLSKVDKVPSPLRAIWAPLTLFYLGGPDTITVLALEENSMWIKHLITLLAQGARTIYVVYISWLGANLYSYLAIVLLFSGLVKYGERVWIIRSRAHWKYQGFVQFKGSERTPDIPSNARPNAMLVLKAFSNFKDLNSRSNLDMSRKQYTEWLKGLDGAQTAFKVIEIELGFMYTVLFTKIGTIFTKLGFILRLCTLSCLVYVLVGVFKVPNPQQLPSKEDFPISIVLLFGAIFMEVAGVFRQLVSDWAVVSANRHQQFKLMLPVFSLQEHLLSKRKRWAESMRQFDLVNFYSKKPTCCGEFMSNSWEEGPKLNQVPLPVKKLIINHFQVTLQDIKEDEIELAFTTSRGKRTLTKYGLLDQFNKFMGLEFDESVIIWHFISEICYHEDDPKIELVEPTKTLSRYMIYLLYKCTSSFSSGRTSRVFRDTNSEVKNILKEKGSTLSSAAACKRLLDQPNLIQELVNKLRELTEIKWQVLSNVWVELLCYAASEWPAEKHAQDLKQGGEFLNHVWLLLVHLGGVNMLEIDAHIKLNDVAGAAAGAISSATKNKPETTAADWTDSSV